jgi:hypothetical protein
LRELQGVIAKLTHNRVSDPARELDDALPWRSGALVHDMLELVADRRPLTPLLQRFAIAVTARDVDTAYRASRDSPARDPAGLDCGGGRPASLAPEPAGTVDPVHLRR